MWTEGAQISLMAEKKKIVRTSVVLTKRARAILARYRNSFGQKNVLSVGVELFDKLKDSEKIRLTDESEAADQVRSPEVAQEQQPQPEQVRLALDPLASTVAQRLVTHARARMRAPQEKKTGTD